VGTRRKFLDWVPYKKLRCDGPGSDLAEPAENMKLQRQKKNHLFFERQGHFKFSDLKFNFSNFSEEKKIWATKRTQSNKNIIIYRVLDHVVPYNFCVGHVNIREVIRKILKNNFKITEPKMNIWGLK
jgi:hypothetical protein